MLYTMFYYIGLVERGNATLSNKLSRWCAENNTDDWIKGLDIVVYNMNTTIAEGINCSPYKAVYGQDPHIFPLFSEYLRQAFPGQRVVNINDLPVDIRNSLSNDNSNHSDDTIPQVDGSSATSSYYTNNIQINVNSYNNNSNVQHISEASSDYQSARDNNSSNSHHSSRSSSSSRNRSSRSNSSLMSSSNRSSSSSSSSEAQRSSDSSSDGYDDSFYYGSESVEHDAPRLYNVNSNYDTDVNELNSG